VEGHGAGGNPHQDQGALDAEELQERVEVVRNGERVDDQVEAAKAAYPRWRVTPATVSL
jgi:hypothetical protein